MNELELRYFCGAASTEAANGLVLEMLQAQLHPAVAQALLAKASPAQLVLQGNILGPRHHAAELLRTRAGAPMPREPPPPPSAEPAEASCCTRRKPRQQVDLRPVQAHGLTSGAKGAAFPEPDKFNTAAAALQTDGAGWVLAPLAFCSWGALLAAVVLVNRA